MFVQRGKKGRLKLTVYKQIMGTNDRAPATLFEDFEEAHMQPLLNNIYEGLGALSESLFFDCAIKVGRLRLSQGCCSWQCSAVSLLEGNWQC